MHPAQRKAVHLQNLIKVLRHQSAYFAMLVSRSDGKKVLVNTQKKDEDTHHHQSLVLPPDKSNMSNLD